MTVQTGQLERRQHEHTSHGLQRRPAGQREPELLVLVRCRDEFMGVRLDADRDAHVDLLPHAGRLRSRREAGDLHVAVDDDPSDARVHGGSELTRRLVVAMQQDALGGETGSQRDGELTAGRDVEREPLLVDPADHRAAQKRLAGVVDVGVRTEGGTVLTTARAEVGLGAEVRRTAVLSDRVADIHPADVQHAVAALGSHRPDPGVERIEILGRRSERMGGGDAVTVHRTGGMSAH